MNTQYIKRDIESSIESFLERREVVAIIGPRQAGKTTLLGQLQARLEGEGRRVTSLNFERPSDAALFDDVDRFAATYCVDRAVIIVDEFHFARDGGQRLKRLYDDHPTVKFIISGSSSLELTFQTGRYLVGRFVPFLLLPFSFSEYLRLVDAPLARLFDRCGSPFDVSFRAIGGAVEAQLASHFARYVVVGGYPGVLTARVADQPALLRALYDSYLLKDIRELLQLPTNRELAMLAQLLAGQIGNLIAYQELGTAVGLDHRQVKRHLHVLEETYVASFPSPYFRNRRLEIVKNPKVYFFDGGFRNAVLGAWAPLEARADAGALVEQAVFVGLRRAIPIPYRIAYWRSKSGAEVDFVVEQDGAPVPIEVKYRSTFHIGRSLRSFIERYRPPRAYVATRGLSDHERVGATDVYAIPAWYWS